MLLYKRINVWTPVALMPSSTISVQHFVADSRRVSSVRSESKHSPGRASSLHHCQRQKSGPMLVLHGCVAAQICVCTRTVRSVAVFMHVCLQQFYRPQITGRAYRQQHKGSPTCHAPARRSVLHQHAMLGCIRCHMNTARPTHTTLRATRASDSLNDPGVLAQNPLLRSRLDCR